MKLLITGGNGQLGWEFTQLSTNACEIIALSRAELDITDANQIKKRLAIHQPDVVINTAAYTAVDKAEQEPELAFKINRDGPLLLAKACTEHHLPLIHLSTDYVFAGQQAQSYQEDDPVSPINVYGHSKLAGELKVREYCDQHIILRVSGVFGIHGHNFVKTILRVAQEKDMLRVVNDQIICPTPAKAIAITILQICQKLRTHSNLWGTYHYCSAEATSWYQFAHAIISLAEKYQTLAVKQLLPITTAEYPLPAQRPAYSVLNCDKLRQYFEIMPCCWQTELAAMMASLCVNPNEKCNRKLI